MGETQKSTEEHASVVTQVAAMTELSEGRYSNFLSINTAKQERIIMAALELFAVQDYAQVSTNEIVKRAEISKGLLFHYFGSKAGLYLYLIHQAVAVTAETLLEELDLTGGDVFDVLWKSTKIKVDVIMRHPLLMQFYVRSFTDTSLPEEIKVKLQKDYNDAYSAMDQITNNLDESLLKAGLEKDKVSRIIYLVCEGMSREVLLELTPEVTTEYWQGRIDELKGHFDFMRQLFYLDEHLEK